MDSVQRILLLETSSRVGGAGLATEAGMVASMRLAGRMRHAGELLPSVARLLAEHGWEPASLTDVYVSIGPGSFTGLRIAVTVARTLAWSIGVRITAVPTLDILARNALLAVPAPRHVAVILDAKRSQVYAAAFSVTPEGGLTRIAEAQLAEPGAFLAACPAPLAVLGEGIDYHQAGLAGRDVQVLPRELWWPSCEHVFAVGHSLYRQGLCTAAGELMPLYIRRPEAEEKWEQLHGPARG